MSAPVNSGWPTWAPTPTITLQSAIREDRPFATFAETHEGHAVHVVGPHVDGGCGIVVRVCATCLVAGVLTGKFALPMHVSHRDVTDPLLHAPASRAAGDAPPTGSARGALRANDEAVSENRRDERAP